MQNNIIYIDVLICLNLFINYFILLGVSKFLFLKTRKIRIILAALLGGVYSLYILLPDINMFFSLIIKLVMSVTIIIVAFRKTGIKNFLKSIACFYSISFAFGGVMFAIWYLIAPNGMLMNNGVIYFNLSPMIFIFSTIVSYIIIRLISRFTGQQVPEEIFCNILIRHEGKEEVLKSKIDTGNSLVEPFSKLPVIVVDYKNIEKVVPEAIKDFMCVALNSNNFNYLNNKNFRFIPFSAVSGEGVLPAFKPDKLIVFYKGENIEREAFIAVSRKNITFDNFHALMNPSLL